MSDHAAARRVFAVMGTDFGALGLLPKRMAGSRRIELDNDVCIADAQVAAPDKRISRSAFQAALHAIGTRPPARLLAGYEAVEQRVREQVPPAQILLELPSFLSLLRRMPTTVPVTSCPGGGRWRPLASAGAVRR